ncbi:DUF5597 domain-containing protein [Dysgonomonadaceae bacterium zrk40]|nr:DUF5597 domain-containing protein [Dysgonomonadaceae bacterium zrk40]
MPRLEKRGAVTQLIVEEKPFLILGGELHNSSSSNLEYLEPVWQQLKDMHLNTVLAAISWQLTEPEEGQFDFSLVDGLIREAREHDLRLVLLWFGSWKNGLSHYVPDWVKQDPARFPRVILDNGKATETVSPLGLESRKADARAFAALMEHLKKVDGRDNTVIMVQVENEVGVLGAVRDYSELGNTFFHQQVPKALIDGLKMYEEDLHPQVKELWERHGRREAGSWSEVFGNNLLSEEYFMAWHYADYINAVAAAGKAQYDLPMFVNAWIVQPEDKRAGDYPSGGPQEHVHDFWRIAAPNIDIFSPDIYLPDFPAITEAYTHSWNPLFIPESFAGEMGAANAFYALGKHAAIGYSPFGIDGIADSSQVSFLAKAYRVLGQLAPIITEAKSDNRITAFMLTKTKSQITQKLGGYKVTASLNQNMRSGAFLSDNGYGIVVWEGEEVFVVAGSNINITFVPDTPGPHMAGFLSVYEGEYLNGSWKSGRLLNGDNIMVNYDLANEAYHNRTGTGAKLGSDPSILKVKLYRFE